MAPVRNRHRAIASVSLAAGALVGSITSAPSVSVQLWALAAGVAIGLPHGALDQPAAAAKLGGRFGRHWPLPFFGFYLSLATSVVLLWSTEPRAALTAFLGLSVLHFGLGDAEAEGAFRPIAVLAHGAAPIVVPAAAHAVEVTAIFEVLAPGGTQVAEFLAGPAALVWAGAVLALVIGARPWSRRDARGPLVELLAIAAAFVALPPLLAFALYFGVLHAPRASLAEAAAAGGPPGTALRHLLRAALPASVAAAVLGSATFLLLRDELGVTAAAMSVIFVGLAALTVPHMALGVALRLAERDGPRPRPAGVVG